MKTTPHRDRNYNIAWTTLLILLIILIATMMLPSCSPRYGCVGTSGKNYKVGYHPNK